MSNTTFEEIGRVLREHQQFVVLSHVRPDGDALGSALALGLSLQKLGKTVQIWNEEGMLEKIDVNQMPNFKNVRDNFRNIVFDPGRVYSAPYLWGTTGFTYDSARVPGGRLEESWKSFFEPPAELNGQIAALNDEVEVYNAAAYYTGVDKCTEDPKEAQKLVKEGPFS